MDPRNDTLRENFYNSSIIVKVYGEFVERIGITMSMVTIRARYALLIGAARARGTQVETK